MLAFLAVECGWDKDFIAEHFTVEQIARYYELIQKQKIQEIKIRTISMYHAVAYAFGSMKKDGLMQFFDMLDGKKEDPVEALKKAGIPVEEG